LFVALTFSDVEEILRIIDRFPAAEIRFEHGDVKLYVKRAGAAGAVVQPAAAAAPPPATAPAATTETVAAANPPPAVEVRASTAHTNVDRSGQTSIDAPLAGVYYAAPSPDAAPFVEVGRQVVKGTELCIIEVMKVMNTVKAPFAGVVVDVTAENGAAVDKGQPLIWIRPATEPA
jgi:acetyl-CoA carboxylase biotin carboxyl carrier protein